MPSSPTTTSTYGGALRTVTSAPLVVLIPTVLIVAQLVVRAWLVATGNFYWDDLILIGRASTEPILSWEYLGHSHDGHFMPAAFLLAGVSTVIAPVNWVLPAVTLVILQALASLAVWRMIRVIADTVGSDSSHRTTRDLGALAALVFYLFTPMTVPAFIWWSAGLNSLPMQAAMAWIVADAVLLCSGRVPPERRRMVVVRSTVVFVVALAFFEKSLFIVPVAFVVAVLATRYARTEPDAAPAADDLPEPDDLPESDAADAVRVPNSPAISVFTRGRALWTALGAVFVAWGVLFFAVSDATAGTHSATQTAQLVWRSINKALVPSLVGGPWEWERWVPSPPMGFAPLWMVIAGWLMLAAVVVWAVMRRAGAPAVLVGTALYVVGAQIPVMWNRSSANTALELAQTMRYLPDSALVMTIAIALLAAAPARRTRPDPEATVGGRHVAAPAPGQPNPGPGPLSMVSVVVGALVLASSLVSVAGYSSSWRDDPTGPYLANARRALADNASRTMFDQSLPLEVLLPVAYPQNQISHTFGRVRDRPRFGDSTDQLIVLDNSGRAVPGAVTPARTFPAGAGTCARPEIDGPARLEFNGPLIQWRWTIAMGYCATADGRVEMSLAGGDPVTVSLTQGLHVIYVQLEGHGTDLRIRPLTPGLAVHTGDGRVGEVVDARLLGR